MSNKKEKNNKKVVEMPNGECVPLRKGLLSASLEPVPYKHSDKFIEDGKNPLDFERERLTHKTVDALHREQRVPAIEADTKHEIEFGKRQYVNHLYECRQIIDKEKGELQMAYDMKNTVVREIAEYEKIIEELSAKKASCM